MPWVSFYYGGDADGDALFSCASAPAKGSVLFFSAGEAVALLSAPLEDSAGFSPEAPEALSPVVTCNEKRPGAG